MITILINNKFTKEKDANVSLLSNISRGYGLFETLRTYKHTKLFKEKDHLKRMMDSAKLIDLKVKYSTSEILKMLQKVIAKSPHKIQRIKIMALEKKLVIISSPLKVNKKIYDGVKCKSIKCTRDLPEIKSISYLASFLSHEKAIKEGYFDAILIDKDNEVYEGAYSNIFWFEGKYLCTRSDKILPGITRKIILEISPFKIKFKKIKLSQLKKKSGIFLTTSISGIVPVAAIDYTKLKRQEPGTYTKILIQKYQECIKKHCS